MECPMCGGPGVYLGQLGNLVHLRCRNCGATFSVTKEEYAAMLESGDED